MESNLQLCTECDLRCGVFCFHILEEDVPAYMAYNSSSIWRGLSCEVIYIAIVMVDMCMLYRELASSIYKRVLKFGAKLTYFYFNFI